MDYDFNRLLSDAAHDLAGQPSVVTSLGRVTELCTESVTACARAGISVVEAGRIRTLAASDDSLLAVDVLQQSLQEGPCCEALQHQETAVCGDLAVERRWGSWGPQVASSTGLRSLLSFCLFASRDSAGVLSIYADDADAFDHDDLLEGQVLAAHASLALATTYKERQLHEALARRTVIGQATGILIERFDLSPDQAFGVMRRVSQNHNIKVHTLAEHLVQTGVLLAAPPLDHVDEFKADENKRDDDVAMPPAPDEDQPRT
jgi:hypothetical protein